MSNQACAGSLCERGHILFEQKNQQIVVLYVGLLHNDVIQLLELQHRLFQGQEHHPLQRGHPQHHAPRLSLPLQPLLRDRQHLGLEHPSQPPLSHPVLLWLATLRPGRPPAPYHHWHSCDRHCSLRQSSSLPIDRTDSADRRRMRSCWMRISLQGSDCPASSAASSDRDLGRCLGSWLQKSASSACSPDRAMRCQSPNTLRALFSASFSASSSRSLRESESACWCWCASWSCCKRRVSQRCLSWLYCCRRSAYWRSTSRVRRAISCSCPGSRDSIIAVTILNAQYYTHSLLLSQNSASPAPLSTDLVWRTVGPQPELLARALEHEPHCVLESGDLVVDVLLVLGAVARLALQPGGAVVQRREDDAVSGARVGRGAGPSAQADHQGLRQQMLLFEEELNSSKCVLVQQRTDWLECLPCCEQTNTYTVHKTNIEFDLIGAEIATIEEAARFYLPDLLCYKCARPYTMNILAGIDEGYHGVREYRGCMYCCLPILNNRQSFTPSLTVTHNDRLIGKLVCPEWCGCLPLAQGKRGFCSALELDIYDDKELIYRVSSPCLNPGFVCGCCGCLADCCSHKEFRVMDQYWETIGKIENVHNGAVKECMTRSDKFGIQFPGGCPLSHKVLLMHAAVFIDFLVFAG